MWDVYDLLLESLGYHSDLGISEDDLIQNARAISELANEIGINLSEDVFDLYLVDDDIHDQIEVVLCLYNLGLDNAQAMNVMYEAHYNGKSKVLSSRYAKLKMMQDQLNENGLKSFIRKVES